MRDMIGVLIVGAFTLLYLVPLVAVELLVDRS